jgi:hypothetical protein
LREDTTRQVSEHLIKQVTDYEIIKKGVGIGYRSLKGRL